jgi:DNA-binding NarL/FixJ family response regulator
MRPPALPLRVAIVEDEMLFRELVSAALAGMPGIEVVGAFGDEASAAAAIPGLQVDLAVLDIDLGVEGSGVRLAAKLRAEQPGLAVVLLSNHREPAYLEALATEDGAGYSYLLKHTLTNLASLEIAIRGAALGFAVLDPAIARGVKAPKPAEVDRSAALMGLLAEGLSNMAIGERLCLAERSVENQLRQLYRRLGIDTGDSSLHPRVCAVLKHLKGD